MGDAILMGTLDPSPRPAWAITAWISDDERTIFVELPMTIGGPPYIMRFDATEKGFKDALVVLKARRKEVELPTTERPANYTPPANQPQVKVLGPRAQERQRLYAETTEAQRAKAKALIAKLGVK